MNNIVAALKKLFSLSGDPKTIAEALDEAEISGGEGLPEVTTADKKKSLAVNATTGQWEVSDRVVVVENGSADLTNGSCRSSYAPVWDTATSQYKRMKVTWLPATGSENKNKTIKGKSTNGEFELVDFPTGLPAVTADDNGKILKVVDGVWSLVTP